MAAHLPDGEPDMVNRVRKGGTIYDLEMPNLITGAYPRAAVAP
jgi:hypothetical protein